jgi:hypothetical protein
MPSGLTSPGQLRIDAPVGEAPIGLDVERRQAVPHGLADDQGLAVGRDRHPVREVQAVGDDMGTPIGIDAGDHAGVHGLEHGIKEIIADIPHIHPVLGIDDAVAQAEGRDVGEVGLGLQGLSVPTVDPPLHRVADQQAAVAPESEGVRDERQFHRRLHPAAEVRSLDPLVVDIQEPQLAVAPARAFGEPQATGLIDQCVAGVRLHGSPLKGWRAREPPTRRGPG